MKSSEQDMIRLLEQHRPAQWILDMDRHFQQNGYYRSEDLRRLFGNPSQGIRISSTMSVNDILSIIKTLTTGTDS